MTLEVWPALDLLDGQAVRLTQGRYSDVTTYDRQPIPFMERILGTLPPRLHLIDLSGARSGQFSAWELLDRLARHNIRIEVGGGFRSLTDIARALDLGVERVILGTQLLTDVAFATEALARYGGQSLVASLDVERDYARIKGWEQKGPHALSAWASLNRRGYVLANVTDIQGDGTLQGLNPTFWTQWASAPGDIGAGGGVSDSRDLDNLKTWGIKRVVVGKAWMEGRLTPEEVGVC